MADGLTLTEPKGDGLAGAARNAIATALAERDWEALEKAYSRYGSGLELMGEDQPVGKTYRYRWPVAR